MSVKITGMKKLFGELEKFLGPEEIKRLSDQALLDGAKVFVEELERQFKEFKKTGASIEEITIGKITAKKGVRTVRIHWKGEENRYRVIHLNEFGTVQQPNPKGKGAIARAMKNAEKPYRKAIANALRRGM